MLAAQNNNAAKEIAASQKIAQQENEKNYDSTRTAGQAANLFNTNR